MHGFAVGGGLVACFHPVVADDTGHAQAVVSEMDVAPRTLCGAVVGQLAPVFQRGLVLPEGKGQQLARFRQAFEPLYRDKSGDVGRGGV